MPLTAPLRAEEPPEGTTAVIRGAPQTLPGKWGTLFLKLLGEHRTCPGPGGVLGPVAFRKGPRRSRRGGFGEEVHRAGLPGLLAQVQGQRPLPGCEPEAAGTGPTDSCPRAGLEPASRAWDGQGASRKAAASARIPSPRRLLGSWGGGGVLRSLTVGRRALSLEAHGGHGRTLERKPLGEKRRIRVKACL